MAGLHPREEFCSRWSFRYSVPTAGFVGFSLASPRSEIQQGRISRWLGTSTDIHAQREAGKSYGRTKRDWNRKSRNEPPPSGNCRPN